MEWKKQKTKNKTKQQQTTKKRPFYHLIYYNYFFQNNIHTHTHTLVFFFTEMVKVTIKWGSKVLDSEITPSEGVKSFKEKLQALTNVPVERQKLMCKLWKGLLKDDVDLAACSIVDGTVITLMGDAATQAAAPKIVSGVKRYCVSVMDCFHSRKNRTKFESVQVQLFFFFPHFFPPSGKIITPLVTSLAEAFAPHLQEVFPL